MKNLIKLRFRRFCEGRMQRIARIVYKVVKPLSSPTLQRLTDLSHEIVKCTNVTGIKAESRRLPSCSFGLADETFSFFLIRAIGEEEIDASLRQIDGRVAAKAAASTRDNG